MQVAFAPAAAKVAWLAQNDAPVSQPAVVAFNDVLMQALANGLPRVLEPPAVQVFSLEMPENGLPAAEISVVGDNSGAFRVVAKADSGKAFDGVVRHSNQFEVQVNQVFFGDPKLAFQTNLTATLEIRPKANYLFTVATEGGAARTNVVRVPLTMKVAIQVPESNQP